MVYNRIISLKTSIIDSLIIRQTQIILAVLGKNIKCKFWPRKGFWANMFTL